MSKRLLTVSICASPLPAHKKMCSSPVKSPRPGHVSSVTPFLSISDDRVANKDLDLLGVTAIIDCRTESEQALRGLVGESKTLNRLNLPLKDHTTEDAAKYFVSALMFIEQERQQSGHVLIHCTRGISRSSAMVCAYLMWAENLCYRQAMSKLHEKHPYADPNPSFCMQLVEFSASRYKPSTAYQVLEDGKTFIGPLTRELMESSSTSSLLAKGGAILLISRPNYVFVKVSEKESTAEAPKCASKGVNMLSTLKLSPTSLVMVNNETLSDKAMSQVFAEAIASL